MSQCDQTFDLKINISLSDLYFMLLWLDYLVDKYCTCIMSQGDQINIVQHKYRSVI